MIGFGVGVGVGVGVGLGVCVGAGSMMLWGLMAGVLELGISTYGVCCFGRGTLPQAFQLLCNWLRLSVSC